MKKNYAAIDVGTHTARLLIAQELGSPALLRPLFRKRSYIRLGEDVDCSGGKTIHSQAIDRTLKALQGFLQYIETFHVRQVLAVATGVVREAGNRGQFLDFIYDGTGVRVRPITGDQEALLMGKGVLHALGDQRDPFIIFDLGGGSTEFFFGSRDAPVVRSVPIGAATLTREHLITDPPGEKEISTLSEHIDGSLKEAHLEISRQRDNRLLVGTGGTVTTLAAMLHMIPLEEIAPERMNGMILERSDLEALFDRVRHLAFEERLRLPGLDTGRAGVILAGSLVVLRVLHSLGSSRMTVSLSDLLEGILINYIEGDENG